jgi:branched-chain amino acid transport system permease protein
MNSDRLRPRSVTWISLLVPLGAIAATVAIGTGTSPSFEDTVTTLLCNMIIVLGLQVFIGNSGVYSFGQLGFAAAGAYLAAFLTLPAAFTLLQTPDLPGFLANAQLGSLSSTLIAAAISGLLAAIVGLPLMRTSTLAIPISTFAFLIVTYSVLANWDAVTGGSNGLVGIPRTTNLDSAGLWAAGAAIVAVVFKWSASGYRLRATREDEVAARSIGVAVMRERMIAFVISGVLCGVGGALAAHQSGFLAPATFYFGATVTTVTMLVVGGARSVLGAVVGAIAVTGVTEVLRGLENGADLFGVVSIGYTPGLALIGLGVVLLATMIAMPNGISGGREAGELPWLRRLCSADRSPSLERSRGAVASPTGRPTDGVLAARGITLAFGGLRVLREVDLTLGPGEALGLIGPNGAGKTTMVNVLSGFQKPDSGTIELGGVDVSGRSPSRLARAGLARTFQAALPFPHLSGLESVAVGAMAVGSSRRRAVEIAADVLVRLDLLAWAEEPAGSMPPGGQRLLGIARALATQPRFLLLDEPAAGLNDAEGEELVAVLRAVLRDFDCGIVLIEHDMSVVMGLCPRVQVLDDGVTLRIGSPEEIQADRAVREAYLGSSFAAGSLA